MMHAVELEDELQKRESFSRASPEPAAGATPLPNRAGVQIYMRSPRPRTGIDPHHEGGDTCLHQWGLAGCLPRRSSLS